MQQQQQQKKTMHTNQSGSYKNADNKIKRNQEQARAENSRKVTEEKVKQTFKKPMCVRCKSSKVKDNLKFKQFI